MLVNMKEMLQDAEKHNYAIGSLNTPNFETLRAVIAAAEKLDCPIIINHAQGHEPVVHMETIAPLMKMYAENAKVPVAMHIDHGLDLNFCLKAVKYGFTSIMCDRSSYPLEKNIALTKQFVDMVHPLGITVEAEIGSMPNNMVDVMAISIGTVHGMYTGKSNLDIQRIKDIRAVTPENVHLGMHGCSGTEHDQVVAAIDAGIKKINYFTAMDTSVAPALKKMIDEYEGRPLNYSLMVNVAQEELEKGALKALEMFMEHKK